MKSYRYSGQGGNRQGDGDLSARVAELEDELARLRREVSRMSSQTLGGLSVRRDPASGHILLGDVPATIEADGIHFKDTALGDGIFWDVLAAASSITGRSTATNSELNLSSSGATAPNDAIIFLQGAASGASYFRTQVRGSTGTVNIRLGLTIFELNGIPLALTDGLTAPGTVADYAQIYVDSADGALKVMFGDGFVATIAADR